MFNVIKINYVVDINVFYTLCLCLNAKCGQLKLVIVLMVARYLKRPNRLQKK